MKVEKNLKVEKNPFSQWNNVVYEILNEANNAKFYITKTKENEYVIEKDYDYCISKPVFTEYWLDIEPFSTPEEALEFLQNNIGNLF